MTVHTLEPSAGPKTKLPGALIAGRTHIPVLDGLRGLAILMVLVVHFYPKALIADTYPMLAMIAGRIVTVGAYGVELFFVLSGFLITGILIDTKHEKGFLKKFYVRRILRIFPLYYGALFVVLVVLPQFIALDAGGMAIADRQLWLWTYMANWPQGWVWDDSNLFKLGHFWSLCVEEHFYLFWPALAALLSTKRLLIASVGLIALGLCSRSVTCFYSTGAWPLLQWSTIQKLDGLAVGALIAIVIRDGKLAPYLPTGPAYARLLKVFLLGTAAYVFLPRRIHLPVFDIVGETLIVALFGLVLIGTLRSQRGGRVHHILTSQFLMNFGKYSYGIYVIHGILRPVLAHVFDLGQLPKGYGLPILYMACYYVLAVGTSVSLAFLSFHLFERPFLRLKRYFDYTPVSSRLAGERTEARPA